MALLTEDTSSDKAVPSTWLMMAPEPCNAAIDNGISAEHDDDGDYYDVDDDDVDDAK